MVVEKGEAFPKRGNKGNFSLVHVFNTAEAFPSFSPYFLFKSSITGKIYPTGSPPRRSGTKRIESMR
jgi:hypothetical protein